MAGMFLAVGLALAVAPTPASADGTLDPSFAGTGQLGLDAMTEYDEYVVDTAIDSQGRILVLEVGEYDPTGYTAAFLIRLLSDGTIDQTFSVGDDTYGNGVKAIGKVESLSLNGMAIDSQGRIMLVGGVEAGPVNWDVFMARVLPDGAYDESFGELGTMSMDLDGGSYDRAYGLTIDSLGRLVVNGGYQPTSSPPKGFVARFTQDGELDPSFASGKGWMVPFSSPSNSTGVADVVLDANGKLLVGGTRGSTQDFSVLRLGTNGVIDSAFGQGGLATAAFDGAERQGIVDLELDPQGRILALGQKQGSGGDPDSSQIAVARFDADGSLDATYGTGGKAEATLGGSTNGYDAALDKIGRLVIAGSITTDGYVNVDGFLTRFGPEGALDTTFGQGGFIRENRPGKRTYFNDLQIDPQDRLLASGYERPGDNVNALAMSRYTVTFPSPPTSPPPPATKCGGKKATIVGTAKRDRLKGTRKRDVIAGLGGNDVIKGLGGNDLICGGAGNDTLVGGPGNDTLNGQAGRDKLVGGPGKDRIIGGGGRDRCLAGAGKRQRLTGCERRR